MANRIGTYMETHGTRFIRGCIPKKLEKPTADGRILVSYEQEGETKTEEFDTVLFAIGRYALTKDLNLDNAGVKAESNGKIQVSDDEQT
jgi:thioredoxin reductase (NADPH)